ncbi:MAG TPA: DUF3795 domain-containing protein [Candidatus Cloacimonadota bacterium]|nr:DUF3795 domain-containing protein [Candidatus Cloacimonadota bacterium]HPS39862.1 DUF3795 domain-containing protein [Candidatus Cloacimonadota bacterium]
MSKLISACGLDCFTCECREATLSGDLERKADIAVRWSKNYDASLTAADINCVGCTEEGTHFAWCNNCPIRACAVSKGYKTCAECAEFPCEKSQFIIANVPGAKENIESLRTV